MAGTTVSGWNQSHYDSVEQKVRLQHNVAVDDLDALRTTVNAIITAAGTDLAAVAAVTPAAAIATAKVADQLGNTTK